MKMTPDAKREARRIRDAAMVAYYDKGAKTLRQIASHFRIGRQSVLNILKAQDAWMGHPHPKNGRTQFLGISVKPETRDAVKIEAERRGVSASEVADEALTKGLERR